MKILYQAQNNDAGKGGAISKEDQWFAVLEAMLVTFFISLLPDLIVLGRPPICIAELWKPFMSAVLMALYAYSRARGITTDEEVKKGSE